VGPFIALRDPYDYIPPGGAERGYFDADNRQGVFTALAKRLMDRRRVIDPRSSSSKPVSRDAGRPVKGPACLAARSPQAM
jgi:hypothetical protein